MNEHDPPRDWHLDRRLQITHVLSTLALGAGAVLYVGDIRKDVEVLKADRASQVARDARQDVDAAEIKRETKDRLDRIEDKLDKLIEFMRPMRRAL